MYTQLPTMGWNSWNTFGCDISDSLIRKTADKIVSLGLDKLGYKYICIDDGWQKKSRENGKLAPDPDKFPNGIKPLADYVHSLGLKLGIYSCAGTLTCAGYPGSADYEFIDAQTFASWDIDYLKYDYCYNSVEILPTHISYRRMGIALANCGREILYNACVWGASEAEKWIKCTGANSWRTTADINDSWESIKSLILKNIPLQLTNGQNCFGDMDMLVVGMNGKGNVGITGCTFDEYFTHFAIWSMFNSPLMIGCDITQIDENALAILKNKEIISINQDPSGRAPVALNEFDTLTPAFVKLLSDGTLALSITNLKDEESLCPFVNEDRMGLNSCWGKTIELTDLQTGEKVYTNNRNLLLKLKPHQTRIFKGKLINAR